MNNGNGEVSVWTRGHLKVAVEETDQFYFPDCRWVASWGTDQDRERYKSYFVLSIPRRAAVPPMPAEVCFIFIFVASPSMEVKEQHGPFARNLVFLRLRARVELLNGSGREALSVNPPL